MKLSLRTTNEITLLGPSQLAGLVVVLIALHLTSLTSYVLFHSLVEVARIIVMGGIFVLAWHSRRWGSNRFLLVVGVASLFIGGVEVLHTLAYKGLGVFSDNDANLPTQLWIVFRYLESATFVVAALLMTRPAAPMAVLMAYSVITLALLASVFYGVFPDCFIEGHGLTRFKIGSESVVSQRQLSWVV